MEGLRGRAVKAWTRDSPTADNPIRLGTKGRWPEIIAKITWRASGFPAARRNAHCVGRDALDPDDPLAGSHILNSR